MASNTTIEAPKPSAAETQMQQMQLGILQQQQADWSAMQPLMLQGMGYQQNADGTITQLSQEQQYAAMSPQQQQQYDLQQAAYDRQMAAYAGELPVSPALEADLQKQQEMIGERLSQSLGPDWMNSTSGQQAMSEFQTKAELLREESRRGAMSTQAGIYGGMSQLGSGSQQQMLGNLGSYPGATSGLFGNLQQGQQSGQYYSGLGLQANMANSQLEAQKWAGLMGGMGSLAGAGLMAYGLKK